MNIRKYFFPLFLSLVAFAPVGALSVPAYAQRAASPVIDNFYFESDDSLAPGSELIFTIEGTPKGKASVRISGINKIIPLQEVSSGVYEGSYIIKRKDRISASNTVRATLRVGKKSTGETISLSLEDGSEQSEAAAPKIDRFTVTPIDKIEPGADLRFAMTGTPGAKAYFTIDGVAANVPMREATTGNYEGSYTIRRLDNFPANVIIFGTLEANGKAVNARLNQALLADAKPPVIRNVYPRDGETIAVSNLTSISATFDDSGGVGIDPKSVKVTVAGKDITQSSQITSQFFNYRSNLPPGKYPVVVTAKDVMGNAVRHAWTFTVAPQAATTLPLQVLNPANNAQVGSGPIEVRGRTAPDARIEVQVQGRSSVAGLFGVKQKVYEQSLRADPNGNFAFSFRPQYSVPGTRYEITMIATKDDLNTELQWVLFQQK